MTSIVLEGKDMLVTPPSFPSKEVKDILGGRWDAKERAWRLPPTSLNVRQLVSWYGDNFLAGVDEVIMDLHLKEWGFDTWFQDELDAAQKHRRWNDLYSFQKEAVEYVCANPHMGSLIGLSPGLGKTPVTVTALDLMQAENVLVLAPLTLALNWGREIDAWSDAPREWKLARNTDPDPLDGGVTITNFETLYETIHRDEHGKVVDANFLSGAKAWKEWREQGPKKIDPKGKEVSARERITQAARAYKKKWDCVVIDESILFKNRKAVKVDVVAQILKDADRVILLSGSATSKFRDDLYSQLKLLMPRAFASYWRFAEYFCIVEKGQWGWNIVGDRPGVDLHEDLKDFYFCRDQKDVLPDLPDYVFETLNLELTPKQSKAHKSMLDEWITELEGDPTETVEAPNRLVQMTRLQQITSNLCNLKTEDGKRYPNASAKEDALIAKMKNEDIDFPLLVWVNYVPTGESYMARILKEFSGLSVAFAHGEGTEKKKDIRQESLDSFKSGDLDVLIMQYEVGKFGHTFTRTRTVYYGDRSWNADSVIQSLRRVRRIGLTHSPVCIIPRCPGTIDDLIERNLEGKFQSISSVSQTSLLELLRSLEGNT